MGEKTDKDFVELRAEGGSALRAAHDVVVVRARTLALNLNGTRQTHSQNSPDVQQQQQEPMHA